MTKWDKGLIVFIVIISLLFIGITIHNKTQTEKLYGIIEVNGEEQQVINLSDVDKPYTIRIENGDEYNIIQVEQGSIRVTEASCPDKDCIKIGKLDADGEISVCLPNKVIVRVVSSNSNNKIDGTTY